MRRKSGISAIGGQEKKRLKSQKLKVKEFGKSKSKINAEAQSSQRRKRQKRNPSTPAKRTGRPGKGNRDAECAHKPRCAARRARRRRGRENRAAPVGMTSLRARAAIRKRDNNAEAQSSQRRKEGARQKRHSGEWRSRQNQEHSSFEGQGRQE